jgi:UMF1 family MFS transporter
MTRASNSRERWGWYFYDWANSAFPTSVVTVFLGPYLTSLAASASHDGFVYPLGIKIAVPSLWPYMVSLSVLLQVLALPLIGAIADYGNRKREMLALTAWIGAGASTALYFAQGGAYLYAAILFLIANVAFGASAVIYNAFLPEIAPEEERDSVSSTGWGFGYLGGGLLLALHLALFSNAATLGLDESTAARIALGSSGLWWGLFTLVSVFRLKNHGAQKTPPSGQGYLSAGMGQLLHTLGEIRAVPHTLLFLSAYLIYNDAIQTVMTMAAQFGREELHLSLGTLSAAILMTQIVAFGGAMLFNQIAKTIGAKRAVLLSLGVWIAVVAAVYSAVQTAAHFFIAAGVIGIVMGGSQALSRSIFSLLIPKGHEAEYFSVYEISDKGTSWLGPLFVGLALQWTGNFRLAILSLGLFFAVGIALLSRVNVAKGAAAAGNAI